MIRGKSDKVLEMVRTFFTDKVDLEKGSGVLVAISGGPDSVCLLHAIHSLGYRVFAAHVNYRLRSESDEEEMLVRDFCTQLNIPLFVHVCRPGEIESIAGSVQMAAREIRYGFFRKLLGFHGLFYCATAHHRDDQVETLLFSLLKGKTPGALNGIPAMNGPYIRPLLKATRMDILLYNTDHHLKYAQDSSNFKRDYLRNRIRIDVLPMLEKINPSFSDRLLEFAGNLDLRDKYLKTKFLNMKGVHREGEGAWRIIYRDLEVDRKYWPLVLEQVLKEVGFSGTQIHQSYTVLDAPSGKGLSWADYSIYRDQKGVVVRNLKIQKVKLERTQIKPLRVSLSLVGPEGLCLDVGIWSVNLSVKVIDKGFENIVHPGVHYMDLRKVCFPLEFRRWKQGDRMQPLGMSGQKKISDIFIDEKVPVEERVLQLIVADQERIILLGGYRISEAVRIDDHTEKVLVIGIN